MLYISINRRIKITTSLDKYKDGTQYMESLLTIIKTKKTDAGVYSCEAKLGTDTYKENATLNLTFPAQFVRTKPSYFVNATREDKENSVTMKCLFKSMYLTIIF